jgi:hypothetical protein
MLDRKMLVDMPPQTMFACGETTDDSEGIEMTGSGKSLKWVAVRGAIPDWCIYIHWSFNTFKDIKTMGDKVCNETNIKRLVPCDDEAFQRYRF